MSPPPKDVLQCECAPCRRAQVFLSCELNSMQLFPSPHRHVTQQVFLHPGMRYRASPAIRVFHLIIHPYGALSI